MSEFYSVPVTDAMTALRLPPAHTPTPRLAALATAVPPYVLDQDAIRAAAAERRVFGDALRVDTPMWRVFDNAGIATRRSCVPIEWHTREHGWGERARVYLDSALALLETAARDCLARAGCAFADIDAVVTVGTTGIAAPEVEAPLLNRRAFRKRLRRLAV